MRLTQEQREQYEKALEQAKQKEEEAELIVKFVSEGKISVSEFATIALQIIQDYADLDHWETVGKGQNLVKWNHSQDENGYQLAKSGYEEIMALVHEAQSQSNDSTKSNKSVVQLKAS